MSDGLHEVRLAETGRAADEEGVVAVGGLVGDVERRGVGELVGGADDEVLERVEGVQVADAGLRRARSASWRDARPVVVLPLEDEADLAAPDAGEAGRLPDLVAVLAGDVVDEKGAADQDVYGVCRLGLLPGPPEPGVEVTLVHPGLEVLEDLLPGSRLFHSICTDENGVAAGRSGGGC